MISTTNDQDRYSHLPDYMFLPFMRACGNIIPLRWVYLKTLEYQEKPNSTETESNNSFDSFFYYNTIQKMKEYIQEADNNTIKLNKWMQRAIQKKDWSIIADCLDQSSHMLTETTFKMLGVCRA